MSQNATQPVQPKVSARRKSADPSSHSVPALAAYGFSDHPMLSSMSRLSEFNLSVAHFLAQRARKNAGILAEFATCRSPQDAIDLWCTATIEAVRDYADEAGRIIDLPQT